MNRILLRRIVSAVDLSDRSVPTLKRALQLAYLHGGELFVVHVANGRLAAIESETRKVTDAFAALHRLTDAQPYHTITVRWILLHGDPAMELARFVRRVDADLAVVGGALPRPSTGVVGTVAHAILRTTGSPVLVIPRTADADPLPTPYREILVGVASERSTQTLRYALSLAQEFESRLTILNVKPFDQAHEGDNGALRADIARLRAGTPHCAHDWTLIDEYVANGEPAQELAKMARKIETDLVVVGSTAAPGSDGGFGSVALGALTLTDASLLIVPSSDVAREIEACMAAIATGAAAQDRSALLTSIEVQRLAASGRSNDHIRMCDHHAVLADEYAKDAKRHEAVCGRGGTRELIFSREAQIKRALARCTNSGLARDVERRGGPWSPRLQVKPRAHSAAGHRRGTGRRSSVSPFSMRRPS